MVRSCVKSRVLSPRLRSLSRLTALWPEPVRSLLFTPEVKLPPEFPEFPSSSSPAS